MALDGFAHRVDIDEGADGVRVPLAARHVAVGARHRAAVRGPRRDEVAAPPILAHGQRLAHAQDEHVALDAHPVVHRALVAVQAGDVPVRGNFDLLRVGETG